MKVLLIDDSSLMRKMVLRALRQADVDVTETFEASNGAEGVEVVKAKQPDLILCDWNMPVMDGLEFVRSASGESGPIIMLTTEGTPEKRLEAMSAGASGYVTKPFTPEKLGAAIRAVGLSKSA